MTQKTKKTIRAVIFFILLTISFLYIQNILRWKGELSEDLALKYEQYCTSVEAGEKIDVLYLGTSAIYAGITPIVMWKEAGFTGMNFGTSEQNVLAEYYLLKYLLEVSTPQVIVLDLCDLTEERLADSEKWTVAYTRVFNLIDSFSLKIDMLKEMVKIVPDLNVAEYLFPIIRYHSRWTELTSSDFGLKTQYPEYSKGALMHKEVKEMHFTEYEKEMEKQDVTVFSKTYYEKILDLCRKKKIKVVAVVPPIAYTGGQLLGKYEEMRKFCEQNNIEYINYNEPDVLEEAGINFSTDFYNEGHLNALGSVKISKSLAKRLAKKYNLEDRREDPAYQSWNMAYKEFNKEYEPWFESIQN